MKKDVVLDPMCGSGTTLLAAKNLGRSFIGIDSNEDAYRISKKRLRSKVTPKAQKIKVKTHFPSNLLLETPLEF